VEGRRRITGRSRCSCGLRFEGAVNLGREVLDGGREFKSRCGSSDAAYHRGYFAARGSGTVSSRPFMRIDADLPRFPLLFLRRRQCLLRMALCQTIPRVMMIDG
jgi:hypothetical protein